MARERQVYPSEMVAHLWANRAQDSARNAHGNFHFTGATLYSYGSHFIVGHWLDTSDGVRLVWNDASYSSTTSRHQWTARAAVRRFDMERAIHVPRLDSNGLRDWHAVAVSCVSAAMSALESAQKARQRRPVHIGEARRYLASARELFAVAREPKAAQAVPDVSADADKAAVSVVLQAVKAAEYIGNAEKEMERARQALAQARYMHRRDTSADMSARMPDGAYPRLWGIADEWAYTGSKPEAVMHAVKACRIYAGHAANFYRQAGQKTVRAVSRILAECDTMAREHEPAAREARQLARLDVVRISARVLYSEFAQWKHAQHTLTPARTYRNGSRNVYWHAERLETAMRACDPGTIPPDVVKLARRVGAAIVCARFSHILADVRADLSTWRKENHEPPRMPRELSDALRYGTDVPEFWLLQIQDVRQRVADARAQWDKEAIERDAIAVEKWRNGEAVRPSHEWPTMARINGDTVETSLGASVPLAHACRLARIARRVMSHGGKSWPDGTGPTVGHFRVNSIAADGAAVIGCHEFSATESARILAELDACPTCRGTSGEDDIYAAVAVADESANT
jgi:hypothetical protein